MQCEPLGGSLQGRCTAPYDDTNNKNTYVVYEEEREKPAAVFIPVLFQALTYTIQDGP